MIELTVITYAGKKKIHLLCKECPTYKCFSPHNAYHKHTGGRKENWVCLTNHNKGCPDTPERKEEYRIPERIPVSREWEDLNCDGNGMTISDADDGL